MADHFPRMTNPLALARSLVSPVLRQPIVVVVLATTALGLSRQSLAGPNEGGVLLLHNNPDIHYTTDQTVYCSLDTLATCADARARIDEAGTHLIWMFAAFPEASSPKLAGLTFGLEYDHTRLTIGDYGSCGDFELPTADWPSPGSGTAVTWSSALNAILAEVYWVAVYAENVDPPVDLSLTWHPGQGANFADDSTPAAIDPIAAFGQIGFGKPGTVPCPAALRSSQPENPPPDEEDLCVFPIELWIDPGNVLALEDQGVTTLHSGEVMILNWSVETAFRINEFDYLPSGTPEPPISDSMISRLYGEVPFIQDLSESMPIRDAHSRYTDAQSALSAHLARTYEAVLSASGDPETAVEAALGALSHPLVVPEPGRVVKVSPDVSVVQFRYDGMKEPTEIELFPTIHSVREGYTHGEACATARRLEKLLSGPGDRVMLVHLRPGNMSIKSGRAAEAYLDQHHR